MRRLLRERRSAPLAFAGLLSFPLFFAALMASSLAVEKPVVTRTVRASGKVKLGYHQAAAGTEAKIWALALVVPAILVVIGLAAILWRRGGTYVVCASTIALAAVLPHRLDAWSVRHAGRFPTGVDLVPDNDPSNLLSRGEWEVNARDTAVSLAHWTIGFAIAVALLTTVLAVLRRRRAGRVPPPPVEALTTGGAPQVAAGGKS